MTEWRLEVRRYHAPSGRVPFDEWLRELDEAVVARILARIDRMEDGNFGNSRSVGGGVLELKIDFGPGYRVYYLRYEATVIILLCAGDKSSQIKDIRRAREFADDYRGEA